jgi:hypothetical protein
MKNGIVIQDNDVSREHCRLIRVMADYELHDLNSMRGTFVSGQRLKSGWLLKPGNVIELGEFVVAGASADAAKVASGATANGVAATAPPGLGIPIYGGGAEGGQSGGAEFRRKWADVCRGNGGLFRASR